MLPPNQQKTSPEDQRNLILAAVLSFGVIALWQIFYVTPQLEQEREAELARQEAIQEAEAARAEAAVGVEGAAPTVSSDNPFGAAPMTRDQALAGAGERVSIETPRLSGSVALAGGRIDELLLKDYRTRLAKDSDPIELLWPKGAANAYYPVFGWVAGGDVAGPTPETPWALAPGSPSTLTPSTPITLVWDNGGQQRFRRTISVDEDYMFTITQSIENRADAEVFVKPYAAIRRRGTEATRRQLSGADDRAEVAGTGWLIHQGPIAGLDGALEEPDYSDLADAPPIDDQRGRGISYQVQEIGWLGFTDKYWMTALAPVGRQSFTQYFELTGNPAADPTYGAVIDYKPKKVGAGETYELTTRFFAGVKTVSALRQYQYVLDDQPEPQSVLERTSDFFFYSSPSRFIDAIDWGWFFFLTKPISELLLAIQSVVGNMGVSIILLTILFKLLLFPLAYKSYVSMSKLKKLQPQMKEIQERAGDDRMKMQQDMMELYRKEKVNPAAGCLPILAQIPIFFSLYKVLFISIELRHAPFFGWVQDLSAPDPTSIFNLFGILPYEVPAFLLIGVWPLLMGFTMWIQQMLNPAPTDPIQEKIFMFLPIIFTFLLAGFASGLVVYWTANNVFTILQQYMIMRSQGVDVDLWGNMKKQLGFGDEKKAGAG